MMNIWREAFDERTKFGSMPKKCPPAASRTAEGGCPYMVELMADG
jgi:hypothetical protein